MPRKLKLRRRKGKKAQLPQLPQQPLKQKQKRLLTRRKKEQEAPEVNVAQPSIEQLKVGDALYKVELKIYGGLAKFIVKKGKVTKAGKIQITVKEDPEYNISSNVTREALAQDSIMDGVWRTSYSLWHRHMYVRYKEEVTNAKTKLARSASGFFTEVELVAHAAFNATKDVNNIKEERHGF